eukprot:2749141-Alexandrium_andersonii.AAC.1
MALKFRPALQFRLLQYAAEQAIASCSASCRASCIGGARACSCVGTRPTGGLAPGLPAQHARHFAASCNG